MISFEADKSEEFDDAADKIADAFDEFVAAWGREHSMTEAENLWNSAGYLISFTVGRLCQAEGVELSTAEFEQERHRITVLCENALLDFKEKLQARRAQA